MEGLRAGFLGDDPAKAALAGAIGAAVAETLAETIGHSRGDIRALALVEQDRLGDDFDEERFVDALESTQRRAGHLAQVGAGLAAFLTHTDVAIAGRSATNAVENNYFRFIGFIIKVFKAAPKAKQSANTFRAVSKGKEVRKALTKKERKDQPWTVREGQEWKEKVVGRAQKTGTPGHDVRSYREAIGAAKRENVDKVYLNRGVKGSSEHPIGRPNTRPDVTVKTNDGKIHQVEVPSKTDKIPNLQARMDDTASRLPKTMQGRTDIKHINGDPK